MDMVVSAGKSRKNVQAFVLLPPDARQAVDLLIKCRSTVGIPDSNPFVFARLTADTPLSGNTELQEVAQSCPGLRHPERITSTNLRRYIATVSQVWIIHCTYGSYVEYLEYNRRPYCCDKTAIA